MRIGCHRSIVQIQLLTFLNSLSLVPAWIFRLVTNGELLVCSTKVSPTSQRPELLDMCYQQATLGCWEGRSGTVVCWEHRECLHW